MKCDRCGEFKEQDGLLVEFSSGNQWWCDDCCAEVQESSEEPR